MPTHCQVTMLVETPSVAMDGKPCDYDEPIWLVNTDAALPCAVLDGPGQSGVYVWHLRIHREKQHEKLDLSKP